MKKTITTKKTHGASPARWHRFTLQIPKDVIVALDDHCEAHMLSRTKVIRSLITDYLEHSHRSHKRA